jgi:magnesium chelatase subunit D
MNTGSRPLPALARRAAELFAVDPAGLVGVRLRAAPGPVRDAFVTELRALLPSSTPWQRLPLHASDDRLLGGLDLTSTLQVGRPVWQRGLLASCDGGVLVLAMAERLPPGTAARVGAVLDTQQVIGARDGFEAVEPARIALLALDEGIGADEALAPALADRLALHLALDELPRDGDAEPPADAAAIAAARARLGCVEPGKAPLEALCAAALALGIGSARAPLLALRAACAAAALGGRAQVAEADVELAAALVLAPRARTLPSADGGRPMPSEAPTAAPPDPAPPPADDAAGPADPGGLDPTDPGNASRSAPAEAEASRPEAAAAALQERVLAAARAAIPPRLLALLPPVGTRQVASAGRSGAAAPGRSGGRAAGTRRGPLRAGARLNLVETLRAAAPWQPLRRSRDTKGADAARILVQRDDLRVTRHRPRGRSTTIFVVDASGSAALHRLAEAKGAVQLLLADCYVRRDSVAVLGFGGRGVELLLPPTRSLARARRALAGLPGGGGTPLAAAIDGAASLADTVRRRGESPLVVLLTDGRANIARDGTAGRDRAAADALGSARSFRAAGLPALLLDTSPQPQAAAQALARAMGARYQPLPHADAERLSQAVRTVGAAGGT